MGATPYSDANGSGVTFRVWAPFAGAVAVAGEFNGWSTSADPLFSEGNDYWSVDLASAGVGQQYKFVVSTAGPPLAHGPLRPVHHPRRQR
jgi:1,4-alpha-glucan branching enzyme